MTNFLMEPYDNTPSAFLVYILIFFTAILFRYFVAAGLFYFYYYVWNSVKFQGRRLSKRPVKKGQLKKEIIWSIKSSAIFALVGGGTYWLWQQGLTAIYMDVSQFGYWYLPVSLVLVLLLHETYYYWVHRWMHQSQVVQEGA